MSTGLVLYDNKDGIGTIRLNRPDKMNAATYDMLHDVEEFLDQACLDDRVRVIVFTGSGRAFCSGIDVSVLGSDFVEKSAQARQRRYEPKRDCSPYPPGLGMFVRTSKPTIAAINGVAVGAGAEFTVQCDFRIAADSARIGFIYSRRGIVSDTGAGTYLLPRIVGLPKALELLYSGEVIDAETALKIGLVSEVVPADQLEEATARFARRLMEGAPLSIAWTKELVYRGFERETALHLSETMRILAAATRTEDHIEGVRSFVERRKAQWKGR